MVFHLLLLAELLNLNLLVYDLLINTCLKCRLIIPKSIVVQVVVCLRLVLDSQSFLKVFLIPVSTQDNKTIRNTIERMLHNKLTLVKLNRRHLSLFEIFQDYYPFLSITLIVLKFKNFRVSDKRFFRLFAFFVQNSQVVPDLVKFRTQSRSLNDCLKRLSEVVLLIKQDC